MFIKLTWSAHSQLVVAMRRFNRPFNCKTEFAQMQTTSTTNSVPLFGANISYSKSVFSGALVIVLDADDVVLAEIAAGLHLDKLQHDLARIFKTVGGADRNVN
jgi:hypothetical protein